MRGLIDLTSGMEASRNVSRSCTKLLTSSSLFLSRSIVDTSLVAAPAHIHLLPQSPHKHLKRTSCSTSFQVKECISLLRNANMESEQSTDRTFEGLTVVLRASTMNSSIYNDGGRVRDAQRLVKVQN